MRASGSVVFNKHKATWNFLWWEAGRRRSKLLGTIRELPTPADAERAAKPYRRLLHRPVTIIPTVNELVVRYRKEEMPERGSTRRGYEVWIKNHILPKWGESKITDLQPYPVELWLKSLNLSRRAGSIFAGSSASCGISRRAVETCRHSATRWNWSRSRASRSGATAF
jgi:hypothetical protein